MISILHNKRLCPGTMTDHVHQLISMISCKNVPVLVGRSACIDEKHNVYLPPLPKDATEKDFLLYFKSGIHEQAHIYGGSDFNKASKDKIHFGLENALEDIRCENLQEKEYPGIKSYRIQAYQYILDDLVNKELLNADPSKDIKGFVRALGKFIIIHIRKVQLRAPQLIVTPSDALNKAYYAHVADLESRLISMYTSDEMFDLSGIIYDRLKDIIKEELEKSQPQKGSNDNNLSENGESGDTVSDPEDTYEMEESRSTEGTDDTSEKSPESNSQESDSNETPQEKELVNESKDSVKSDSSDEKRQEEDSDNGTEKSADESEESNCEEGGEGTGDASGQLPPVESSGEKYSGRPLPDKTNEGTPPGEVSCDDDERDGKGHGTEETGDDQEKHMHAEGDDSSTVNGNDGDSTRDAAPKSPDQSGDQEEGEKVNEGHDDHLKNRPPRNNYPGDTGDGHSDASDTISGDDRPTSGKDGEDHASDEIINKRVQKLIDDLNASDESFDIMTVVNKAINNTSINDLPYMVDPSVKDVIIYGREVTDMEGTMIRDIGLKMLGSKGAQLTKLFISQTKPRIMYNRTTGSLDVLSFATDMHDNREDVFKNLTGAKLDKAAVSFMVDNSSSTRNIIGDMYAILSGILQIMSRACIPTEAIGYTAEETESDQWRDIPAHLTIIKEFKESYSGKVLRRCAPPDFLGLTNDLDCMRFCVPRLWARPEKKKVLIVLCDGSPYFRSSVLTEKLQRSYKEYIDICRKAGIVIFGIGIGADLSEYFGDDFAMVDTTNVGEVLMTKLTKILNQGRG